MSYPAKKTAAKLYGMQFAIIVVQVGVSFFVFVGQDVLPDVVIGFLLKGNTVWKLAALVTA
jgi:hypothetical protein